MSRLQWHLARASRSIGLPGWVGLALALASAAVCWGWIAPPRAESARLALESANLEQQIAERRTAAPPGATPQQQLEAFARRFPAEKGMTAALARLHAAARRSKVQLDQAEFRFGSEPGEPLARYTILLPLRADYRALRRFTRDALRDLPAMALQEVNLRRSDTKTPELDAQLRFVLFVTKGD
jgi:hypothetical protein